MIIIMVLSFFSLCTFSITLPQTSNILKTELIKRNASYTLYDISSTTPLNALETYTSEIIPASAYSLLSLVVAGKPSNATGTLYIEFSPDQINWDRVITIPVFNLSQEPPHTALPVSRFCRIRYVNNEINQSEFRLQALFHTSMSKGLTAQLNGPLTDYTDVENTRAILAGKNAAGNYGNVLIGNNSALEVNIRESTTAFGEISVAEPTAIVQLDYLYNLHPALVSIKKHGSGSAITENSMLKLATGASTNSYASMESVNLIHYNPGQGAFCRFSCIYSSGTIGSTQYSGAGNESNGFCFGYKDNVFGILRRSGGSPEVRTLTITNPSTTNETISITLDSNTKNDITVTNSNNATITANEIAAANYSNVGSGWTAKAVNNTVLFFSLNANSTYTNTYSVSGTSLTGNFTRTIVGITPTEYFTPQSQWNVDSYDGNGKSKIILDPTKGNIYQIRWQWLGFGLITYSIENPFTGIFDIVHIEKYSNTYTIPSIASPQLPLYHHVTNTTNNSNIILYSGSAAGFIDGKVNFNGVRGGASGTNSNVKNIEIPIFSLRNKLIYQGKINYKKTKVNIVSVASIHSKPVELRIYGDATLTGANFATTNAFSNTEFNTTATSFSGGAFLFSIILPPNTQQVFFLTEDKHSGVLPPGSTFTITARNLENSQAGTVSTSFNFVELR